MRYDDRAPGARFIRARRRLDHPNADSMGWVYDLYERDETGRPVRRHGNRSSAEKKAWLALDPVWLAANRATEEGIR